MHRLHDANDPATQKMSQFGPAWRDVVLSRRGYAQYNAGSTTPVDKNGVASPDAFQFGLNPLFPTVFANPFRDSDAGDLVPVQQMVQFGVDASMLRKHPFNRGSNDGMWGAPPLKSATRPYGDARDAGFGLDSLSVRAATGTIPDDNVTKRDSVPLFSELKPDAYFDSDRNPANMYQPMTRLGNLVTDRSGVFAVWITVGYFEVEKAPDWNDVKDRFGGDITLYNRVYPDGYMLGKEVGSDTGDVKRPRGFYIIDRTEPVGFKPGEDLNVEKAIRLRRRIE